MPDLKTCLLLTHISPPVKIRVINLIKSPIYREITCTIHLDTFLLTVGALLMIQFITYLNLLNL